MHMVTGPINHVRQRRIIEPPRRESSFLCSYGKPVTQANNGSAQTKAKWVEGAYLGCAS